MESFAYVLQNKAALVPTYYVGKSNNPDERLRQHRMHAFSSRNNLRNSHLYQAIRKYGPQNFHLVEKYPYESEAAAFIGERDHILRFKALGCRLYNKSAGGYGGQKKQDSEETRRRKSASAVRLNQRKDVRERKRRDQIGRVKSPATCEKLSLVKRKPVECLDPTGVVLAVYDSALAAEKATGSLRAHICACCKGNRPRAGGYLWRYK
jgi:predicted GIY-YIG superfamily endonuclease